MERTAVCTCVFGRKNSVAQAKYRRDGVSPGQTRIWPEIAVAGVFFHAFEWLFVRTAPLVLIAAIGGIILTRKRRIQNGKFIQRVSSGTKVDK